MKKPILILFILFLGLVGLIITIPTHNASVYPDTVFFEDFEDPFSGWTYSGLWHREDNISSNWPVSGVPSPDHYMWFGDNSTGNYDGGGNQKYYLTSGAIDLTQYTGELELTFYSYQVCNDPISVEVSNDNGATWHHQFYLAVVTSFFAQVHFDISVYHSSMFRVKFVFDNDGSATGNDFGW
ncbi:MAG: hypothetical protein ACFE9L_05505 [Candidatus Hodarchaeota archaeon]